MLQLFGQVGKHFGLFDFARLYLSCKIFSRQIKKKPAKVLKKRDKPLEEEQNYPDSNDVSVVILIDEYDYSWNKTFDKDSSVKEAELSKLTSFFQTVKALNETCFVFVIGASKFVNSPFFRPEQFERYYL